MLGTIKGKKLFPIYLIHLSWTVNLNFFPVLSVVDKWYAAGITFH